MNADGSNQTNISNDQMDNYPSWSPDGSKIAFCSQRFSFNNDIFSTNIDLYVMNADGSNRTNITNNPESVNSPSWSPDGSQIAFSSYIDGNSEIYVISADGSNQTNLTNDLEYDGMPSWSPRK